jgi:P27 family predicted phage terminase small subunit
MSKGRRPKVKPGTKLAEFPARPEWLTGLAAGEWDRVAAILAPTGTVQDLDTVALAAYCQTYQRWREAEAAITTHGAVYHETGKPNPAVRQSDALLKQLRGLLAELGFTPASRGRLDSVDPQHPDEQALDELVNG